MCLAQCDCKDSNNGLMSDVYVVHVDILDNCPLHSTRLGQAVLSTMVAQVSGLRENALPSRTQ